MSGLRILVVDDNERLRRSLAGLLESEPGWAVCAEARNSREAVDAAIAAKPDLILLDLNLPDATASETASLIRSSMPQAALIMISSNNPEVLAAMSQQVSVDGWLDKSRIGSDLVPMIKKWRAQRSASQPLLLQPTSQPTQGGVLRDFK